MRLRRILKVGLAAAAALAVAAGASPAAGTKPDRTGGDGTESVRVIGELVVPKDIELDGLPVGELSGLDYRPRTGEWVLIADDTGLGPARFFSANIDIDRRGLHGIEFTDVHRLLRTDGTEFPPASEEDPEVADPEGIRFDPRDGTIWWSSEGKRVLPDDGSAPPLVDPWVRQASRDGEHLRELRQPSDLRMSVEEVGPRHNLAFEGLSFTVDGRQLVTAMEGPLFQDGPVPSVDAGAVNRLTWYHKRSGLPVRQLAYEVDPIPVAPVPPDGFADNGVTEILAIDRHRYLIVERSYAEGVGNSIRLYEIDVRGATNVLYRHSLADGGYRPVTKRLVADLGTLGLSHVDNIEGMAWGPTLRKGERTLVLVSDDNFNDSQVQQVIALGLH